MNKNIDKSDSLTQFFKDSQPLESAEPSNKSWIETEVRLGENWPIRGPQRRPQRQPQRRGQQNYEITKKMSQINHGQKEINLSNKFIMLLLVLLLVVALYILVKLTDGLEVTWRFPKMTN